MSPPKKLSVVLAVCDEEAMLRPCLELLDFADEIVVVIDTRTTDQSKVIARQFTSRVFERPLKSFAEQKNYAISKARGEWTLIVDADERITPALAKEIKHTLVNPGDKIGFRIPRINFFFGRPMHHGGWGNDKPIRLIRKIEAVYSGDIHEVFRTNKAIGELKKPMWHFSHRSIQSMLVKTVRFGEIQSEEMFKSGHPKVTSRSLLAVPVKEFYRRFLRQRGYKDGVEGVIESIYQAFSLCFVCVMLWQKQRESPDKAYSKLEAEAEKMK